MALVAPTRGSMQQLLDICAEYGRYFCLKFNVDKSKIMVFGKLHNVIDSISPLVLNNDPIEYVTSMRYLGFYLTAGLTFRFSITEDLCKFYGAVNSVLTVLTKPTEDILLKLLYSNCVPILTYGAAVKDLTAK